jgi:hypothetical protein
MDSHSSTERDELIQRIYCCRQSGAFFGLSVQIELCGQRLLSKRWVGTRPMKAFTFQNALDGYELIPSRSGIVQRPKGGLLMTMVRR